MTKPKVVLKNVKTFFGMDGYGLNAYLYINGMKCLFVIDEGCGGEFLYHHVYDEKNKAQALKNLDLLDEYIKTLPPFKAGDSEFPMNMDLFIDQILAEQEEKKHSKKMDKLQQKAIIFGKPNGTSYSFFDFSRPLSAIPFDLLKIKYNNVLKNHCKGDVVILNTNLKELGLV